jgi:hypothetical protein
LTPGCSVLTLGQTKGTDSRAERSACPLCLAQSHSFGLGNGDRHLKTKGTDSRAERSACLLCLAQSHSFGLGNGDRHLAEYSRSQSPFPRPNENETTLALTSGHRFSATHSSKIARGPSAKETSSMTVRLLLPFLLFGSTAPAIADDFISGVEFFEK